MPDTKVFARTVLPEDQTDIIHSGQNSKPESQTAAISSLDDFLALIKIGIIKSNLITAFTGVWLALHFGGLSFLDNMGTVALVLFGTAFVIGGAGTLNNYIDRDIDHLMERTSKRPTVTAVSYTHLTLPTMAVV